jgi:hypothetical protein
MFLNLLESTLGLSLETLLLSLATVFISVPLAVIILLGYLRMYKRKIELPKRFLSFLFAALLFPVGEALIGSAAYDTQSAIARNTSLLLFGLSIVFALVATVTKKGRRLFIFGISCAFVLWTFWATFFAGMAIDNSWL